MSFAAAPRLASAAASLSFAVVPHYDQRHLFAVWKPVVDEIQRRSGVALKLATTLTVGEFERDVVRGTFDFVYVNPLLLLRANERQGYRPLVRDSQPFHGIVVVKKESALRELGQLGGMSMAVPSRNALASLMVLRDLEESRRGSPRIVNVRTHTAVYAQVASGGADCGAGTDRTFHQQAPELVARLRVIHTTRQLISHSLAVHQRVADEPAQRVAAALAGMRGSPLLAGIPMVDPVPASMADYQPVAGWGLDRLWVEGGE